MIGSASPLSAFSSSTDRITTIRSPLTFLLRGSVCISVAKRVQRWRGGVEGGSTGEGCTRAIWILVILLPVHLSIQLLQGSLVRLSRYSFRSYPQISTVLFSFPRVGRCVVAVYRVGLALFVSPPPLPTARDPTLRPHPQLCQSEAMQPAVAQFGPAETPNYPPKQHTVNSLVFCRHDHGCIYCSCPEQTDTHTHVT